MAPPAPTSIGPYRVVRELGRGGMGVVYEVTDAHGRRLALKLTTHASDADALVRFAREAELLARVRHPGVVVIHAVDRCEAGPFLVTDLVDGRGLKELAREAPLEPRRAAELARALADAVGALHAQGILHRDLKPENVIVRPDDGPVLLDFGLAREVQGASLTQSGTLLGTPAYMAPEQAEARRDLDARADVYGLGGLLFFMLSGRPPFQGAGVALLFKVLHHEPDWPSSTRPDVPAELEAICRAAMTKDREARTPTAAAVRDDLDLWLRGDRPRAAGPLRSARSRLLALRLGAAALVAVAIALFVSRGGGEVAAPGPPPAVAKTAPAAPITTAVEAARGLPPEVLDEIERHRTGWRAPRPASTAPARRLAVVVAPLDRGWAARARFLDDGAVVLVHENDVLAHIEQDLRLVPLRRGEPTRHWTELERGPVAQARPHDTLLREVTVIRDASGKAAAIFGGDTHSIGRIDVATASGVRIDALWKVPADAIRPDAITPHVEPDRPLMGTAADEAARREHYEVYALAASHDGRVAVGGDWRWVWLVDVASGVGAPISIDTLTDQTFVSDLGFSRHSRLAILRAGRPGPLTTAPWRIEVWDAPAGGAVLPQRILGSDALPRARSLAWSSNGWLASGHDGGVVVVWSAEGEQMAVAHLGPDALVRTGFDINDLVWSSDERELYLAMDAGGGRPGGALMAWCPGQPGPSWREDFDHALMSVDVSPDGALLVVGDANGGVTLLGTSR